MKKILSLLFILFFAIMIGCDAGKPRSSAPIAEPSAVEPAEPDAAKEPAPEPERVLVDIGKNVTGKADFAKDGDKHIMAPILVPLGEYFTMRERVVFNIQVPEAVKLYKAEHDNKGPATHEDYMRDIIEANKIKLPALKNPTDEYQYDPESGELKISTIKK